jgi:hypothetical protein
MASSVSKDEQEFDMVRVVLQQIYDSLKWFDNFFCWQLSPRPCE